ncbi:MAG: hypothetical protein K0S47_557 [Herbinix sp.]|jgi:hypothetical protein|nr:hypothetical protein [Herbinix sp.]
MKHEIYLHQLFNTLNPEDIPGEENSDLTNHINTDRILQLTLEKVQNEKKAAFPIQRHLLRVAMAACIVLCISGATVFAATNETVRETLSDLLGISQTEILTVGKNIANKDYKLTVHEIACDSYAGIVTISVEALSSNAMKTFLDDNIIEKLGHLGSVGYGLRELDDLRTDDTRYFSYCFNVSNTRYLEDGLTFSMIGISKEIKIPITQTVKLTEIDIDVPSMNGYPASYQKLYYSELGFTLLGKSENEWVNKNCNINLEFKDGSTSHFYRYYDEQKNNIFNSEISSSESHAIKNGMETSITSSSDVTTYNDPIIDFDSEWFSGRGNSCTTSSVTTIFSFSKKMEWSTVKSIVVNGITIRIK